MIRVYLPSLDVLQLVAVPICLVSDYVVQDCQQVQCKQHELVSKGGIVT